jgi:hypothetical protein
VEEEEIVDSIIGEIEEIIETLTKESSLYRGVYSNVAKINMENAICLNKPMVIEGMVEMEDVFSDKHIIFIRPKSEKATLIVPRFQDQIYSKTEYFDIYVYANGVWLNGRTASFSGEGCEFPIKVLKKLLSKQVMRDE